MASSSDWRQALKKYNQGHLIAHLKDLPTDQQTSLTGELAAIDFTLIDSLFRGNEAAPDWSALADKAEPPNAIRLGKQPDGFTIQEAIAEGEQSLRRGEVAMILAAGGQGTRLGFDHPKGMFRIGPLSSRTLFEVMVDRLRALMHRFNCSIPLYVMTSPATDAQTRLFFSEFDRFGLAENELRIFCQGTMPAVDAETGKILLSSPYQVARSPNGHGGLLAALADNGCLEDAADRGVKNFFYCQIDNPMVQLCDPALIGSHLLSKSQITTQVVAKRYPLEKVGNVVSIDGRTQIIEYSDLPEPVATKTAADGTLKFWAGNIAVHVFDRKFMEAMQHEISALPFHRAHKKVPHLDADGKQQDPQEPNAYKFERFIFDLLPMAKQSLVVEGEAAEVFAPVKNADGAATDTPAATKQAMSDLSKKWLRAAGAKVADDAKIEIHPSWALDEQAVKTRVKPGTTYDKDTYLQP